MYWSLSQIWLEPTHSLPADTVLCDPTPSIVPFHTASTPFTSKKNTSTSPALHYRHPHIFSQIVIFCKSQSLCYLSKQNIGIPSVYSESFSPQSLPPWSASAICARPVIWSLGNSADDGGDDDHWSNNDIRWRKYLIRLQMIQCPLRHQSPHTGVSQLSCLPSPCSSSPWSCLMLLYHFPKGEKKQPRRQSEYRKTCSKHVMRWVCPGKAGWNFVKIRNLSQRLQCSHTNFWMHIIR